MSPETQNTTQDYGSYQRQRKDHTPVGTVYWRLSSGSSYEWDGVWGSKEWSLSEDCETFCRYRFPEVLLVIVDQCLLSTEKKKGENSLKNSKER